VSVSRRSTNKATAVELTELAERLRSTISNFVRAVRLDSDTPTTAQSETLAVLDRHGAMSTAQLAALRNVKHQSMRLVIGQLERERLIEKSGNPQDGRSQLIVLTLKGRDALGEDRRRRGELIAQALCKHTSAEERRTLVAAVAILERITPVRKKSTH